MKKVLFFLFILCFLVNFTSCTKETTGPQGSQGLTGPTGSPGQITNYNFILSNSDFTYNSTSNIATAFYFNTAIDANSEIFNLFYVPAANNYIAMPMTQGIYIYSFVVNPVEIKIIVSTSDGSTFSNIPTMNYRLSIIKP